MIIGVLRVKLYMPNNDSLKAKRTVLKSLKDKLRNRFNVSVAEIDELAKWQRATLGISCVGNDTRYVNEVLCKTVDLICQVRSVELIDYDMEML